MSNLDVTDQDKIQELDQRLTIDELFETLKSCADSAPGPDGVP